MTNIQILPIKYLIEFAKNFLNNQSTRIIAI